MFSRARRRLTVLHVVLFAIVLATFSLVFYVALATVLQPSFDLGPDVTSDQAADIAYRAALERIAVALAVANVVVIGLVGGAAWLLADRTLAPVRDAHERQRRFVADASHEIRTPLAVVHTTAEAALEHVDDPGATRRALQAILEANERLTRVASDLLVLARADRAEGDRRDEPIDLSVIAAEAVERHRLAHPEASAAISTHLAPGLAGQGDPDEIGRIVANLLDNALRYGGPSVAVTIETRAADGLLSLAVRDDGPGIAAADLARVIEPFYRVHADADAPDGSGLGLAIAASLARRNGGELRLHSEPGSGTTARLTLPRFR